jgi:hypothetical protein
MAFLHHKKLLILVISIALKSSQSSVYQVWGLGEYDHEKCEVDMRGDLIQYHKCSCEEELLAKFLGYWTKNYPDVILVGIVVSLIFRIL